MSISFHQPPDLDPERATQEGSFPMSETNEGRGALFRIPDDEKKNDKWPDMRGDITLGGVKYKLAGWTKQDKNGRKYLSLNGKPAEEQQQRQQPAPANAYAAATGRDDRQRQPDRGGPDFGGDHIPFMPDR
jgi:hypothetical protein